MNILPKKRWHVKNKDNADRVEADELKVRQKQKYDAVRSLVATQEARVDYLRRKSSGSTGKDISCLSADQSLRLFADVEDNRDLFITNKDYEDEKKVAKETLEKKVGILNYLVESNVGKPPEKPWWLSVPSRTEKCEALRSILSEEVDVKRKQRSDPLFDMKKVEDDFTRIKEMKLVMENKERLAAVRCISAYPACFPDDIKTPELKISRPTDQKSFLPGGQSKDTTKSPEYNNGNDSAQDRLPGVVSCVTEGQEKISAIEKLRAERLARERSERERAAVLLCKSMGLSAPPQSHENLVPVDERKMPFNSAFNPELSTLAAERRNQYRESRKRPHF